MVAMCNDIPGSAGFIVLNRNSQVCTGDWVVVCGSNHDSHVVRVTTIV